LVFVSPWFSPEPALASETDAKLSVTQNESVDVYFERGAKNLPVVFLVNSRYYSKADWQDYPRLLAQKGYFVAAVTTTGMATSSVDIADAIDGVLKKYASILDSSRVAFIGEALGGLKVIDVILQTQQVEARRRTMTIKTAVFLSVFRFGYGAEDRLPEGHVPVLALYATRDRFSGAYLTSEWAEARLSEPKKIVAIDGVAHGHELVTEGPTRDLVRAEIDAWLKRHLGRPQDLGE
jgi:pimeloyl-ACP methyl ester carboxylesterase